MLTLKKTSLFEEHKKLGAKLVEFAGFEMPIQYSGIIREHNAVRTNAGVFDVSHMGEFLISGIDALNFLNYLVPNNIKKIQEEEKGLYTQICNEDGGTIDDLIIYNLGSGFLAVVNAANIEKDWKHFNKYKINFNVELKNISDEISLIAIQGPKAEKFLAEAIHELPLHDIKNQQYFEIKKYQNFWIGRTGYTGEDGFEIFIFNSDQAIILWQKLLNEGVEPCGLGARDTLRLEAAYPLYGHELDEETSPLEAGLGWSVKPDKENFIGKEALLKQKHEGLKKKMVCLKINDKLIARQGHKVFTKDNKEIGLVTSGSQGITVGYPIATAYVLPQYSVIGTKLLVQIRDKFVLANVVKRPFYDRQKLSS